MHISPDTSQKRFSPLPCLGTCCQGRAQLSGRVFGQQPLPTQHSAAADAGLGFSLRSDKRHKGTPQ